MNKFKKIAASVVSIVMAGTMVGSLAACGGNENEKPGTDDSGARSTTVSDTRFNATTAEMETKQVAAGYPSVSVLKSNDKKLAYTTGTEISVNIIDSGNTDRHISYDAAQIATVWKGIDGYNYYVGSLKPAWWQLGQDLGVNFKDNAESGRSGKELQEVSAAGTWAQYNLINSSVGAITSNVTDLLDLSKYLDYMPNFKAFLNEYKIVEWSLKMDTDGGMYYIPYFDGNDDIEKYELVQRDWVKAVLDAELSESNAISYLDQYKAKVNKDATEIPAADLAAAFMGTTGSWSVDTTDPTDGAKTVKLEVNYDAVVAALADANSDLAKAIAAISGATVGTASGNIVDIQNDIITSTKGAVKGNELAKVLREYIKVAYKLDGKAYTTLSDIFVSASAGWDADLMVAMFRCVVTNYKAFTGMANADASEVYALAGREGKAQRQNDLIALAGELYGVRGLESRLDNMYIGADGELKDARLEAASYDAAAKLNALAKEGLLYTGGTAVNKLYKAGSPITFMLHDYAQTQTKDGFTSETFDLAPIVTPVSMWDDNGDGTTEPMRFTESWRSVKNSGVAIPKASVQNPNTLSAVLSFVDYLFSNDGQIIGSYGPRSTTGNENPNGFWYGNNGVDVLNADGTPKAEYADMIDTADGEQYFLKAEHRSEGFMYGNVLYQGMAYKDKQIPIMTTNNKTFYEGGTVNNNKMDTNNQIGYKKNHTGNYTDYARGVVGAALPIGNKDQGFEYQCTSKVGIDGAAIVNTAIQNGSIKHLVQEVNSENWWYTVLPTVFPVSSDEASLIGKMTWLDGSGSAVGVFNPTSTAGYSNIYIDLAFYGYNTTLAIGTVGKKASEVTDAYVIQPTAEAMVNYLKSQNGGQMEQRYGYYKTAWNWLKNNNA